MLKVYMADWCPHCVKAIAYLERKRIPFEAVEIENEPESVVNKIIEVNGGDDWVIPTLENKGKWIPGKIFTESSFEKSLKELGLL